MIQTYAEWDENELLLLSIPHKNSDWKSYLNEILDSYEELVSAISKYQKILMIAPNFSDFDRFKKFQNVEFIQINTDDTWIRDYGAIDVKIDGRLVSYDFTFNAWGNKFASKNDNELNKQLFKTIGGELIEIPLILEGGSIDFNSKGTMLTTTKCLLNHNRNGFTKDEMQLKLKELFGLDEIIWLEHGFILGDDTDSHVDTLARFINENTIAYAACDDENDEHYVELKKMQSELKRTKYNLLPLYLPQPIKFEGRRLGATYCNFVFVNGALIVPTYGDKVADARAIDSLKEALPNLDIVGVDSRVFIRQNGSLHCSTKNHFKAN